MFLLQQKPSKEKETAIQIIFKIDNFIQWYNKSQEHDDQKITYQKIEVSLM